jgi:hypothetical protein
MDDGSWQRRCALCGALDADHAYAAPDDDGGWECPRCEAVRYLWEPTLDRGRDRRRATG